MSEVFNHMKDELETFDGLVQTLTSLRNSIIELGMQCAQIRTRLTDLEKQVEEHRKRWLE